MDVFKKLPTGDVDALRKKSFGDKKFVCFWNNRNAGRKQSGTLIFWWAKFLEKVGKENAVLLMHTEPKDPVGQDLEAIIQKLGLTNGEVIFSNQKLDHRDVAMLYNISDVTTTISYAEGFGLSVGESLCCETPVVAVKTGGITDQMTDGTDVFGWLLEPTVTCVVGGQDIPYINEDRISEEQFVNAMLEAYNQPKSELQEVGKKGRAYMEKNFNAKDYVPAWDKVFTDTMNDFGSWPNRNYQRWTVGSF
jgi:glycosyltransferase involved in cell wall biosynthesis